MKVQQLTIETWPDFEALMSTDPQCSDCWCLNHREPSGCPTGMAAKERMKVLTSEHRAKGLLAYSGEECVGWIAIDPMSELTGHDCQNSGKDQEWSIHCLFVKDGFRGQGVSTLMIQKAIEYARAQGAKIISAFPIPTENRSKFPVNEAEFSGRLSTYQKLGFRKIGEASEFYQRVEL